MDYISHYNRLIDRAPRVKPKEIYTEKHHIIPECLGGSNDKINLCYLTAEEHYVAHQLLVKIYPTESKLVFAAKRMATRKGNKIYGWLKRLHSKRQSEMMKNKSPEFEHNWRNSLTNRIYVKPPIPSKKHREYMSIIMKKVNKEQNKITISCIRCRKTGQYANMARHHFPKCVGL